MFNCQHADWRDTGVLLVKLKSPDGTKAEPSLPSIVAYAFYLPPCTAIIRSHLNASSNDIWCPPLINCSRFQPIFPPLPSTSIRHLPLFLRPFLTRTQPPKPLQHIPPCLDHDALNVQMLTARIHIAAVLFPSFDQRAQWRLVDDISSAARGDEVCE
jgi:hypothetical protein